MERFFLYFVDLVNGVLHLLALEPILEFSRWSSFFCFLVKFLFVCSIEMPLDTFICVIHFIEAYHFVSPNFGFFSDTA